MLASWKNTAVIIPVYNAEKYLSKLIEQIKVHFPVEQIYAIDDASDDCSLDVCKEQKINTIQLAANNGKGFALQKGFCRASGDEFTFAFTIDSDLQHNPEQIPAFMEYQNNGGYDLVIGRREFDRMKMPLPRICSNTLTSRIVSIITKTKIPDSQCGFRLYNLELIKDMNFRTRRYQFETEIIIKLIKNGGKIGSMPIETIYAGQKSYISHWRDIKNFANVIYKEIRDK